MPPLHPMMAAPDWTSYTQHWLALIELPLAVLIGGLCLIRAVRIYARNRR